MAQVYFCTSCMEAILPMMGIFSRICLDYLDKGFCLEMYLSYECEGKKRFLHSIRLLEKMGYIISTEISHDRIAFKPLGFFLIEHDDKTIDYAFCLERGHLDD